MERFEVREEGGHRQADGLIRCHVGDRNVRVTVQQAEEFTARISTGSQYRYF